MFYKSLINIQPIDVCMAWGVLIRGRVELREVSCFLPRIQLGGLERAGGINVRKGIWREERGRDESHLETQQSGPQLCRYIAILMEGRRRRVMAGALPPP